MKLAPFDFLKQGRALRLPRDVPRYSYALEGSRGATSRYSISTLRMDSPACGRSEGSSLQRSRCVPERYGRRYFARSRPLYAPSIDYWQAIIRRCALPLFCSASRCFVESAFGPKAAPHEWLLRGGLTFDRRGGHWRAGGYPLDGVVSLVHFTK